MADVGEVGGGITSFLFSRTAQGVLMILRVTQTYPHQTGSKTVSVSCRLFPECSDYLGSSQMFCINKDPNIYSGALRGAVWSPMFRLPLF